MPLRTREKRRGGICYFMIAVHSTTGSLRSPHFTKSIGFCSTTTIRNGSIFCHASEPKRGRLLKTLEQAQTIDICWKVMFPATSTVAESTLPNLALGKGRKSKLHEDRGPHFVISRGAVVQWRADGRTRKRTYHTSIWPLHARK